MSTTRIGVIGTGFVARHFVYELGRRPAYALGRVLTRRSLDACAEFPCAEALTRDIDEVLDHSDVVLECTGDVLYAAETVGRALAAGKPVVTLNAEFHATIGSDFVERGILSEAEGDQPGCQAALHEEAVAMGFTPLAYGNMKGFLNRTPTPEDMEYWGKRQGISLPMVTSFTDGTKLQVEQALVANGLGATIAQDELLGPAEDDLNEVAKRLGAAADELGTPISDYVLSSKLPHGVFIVCRHEDRQVDALRYLKLGDGPYYTLIKPNILVHLEIFKTVERLLQGGKAFFNNSANPTVSVATVVKRPLAAGTLIERGAGSFDLRGVCVRMRDRAGHLPICLAENVRLKHAVEPGQMLTFDDVEVPDSTALSCWKRIEARVLAGHGLARAS